MLRRRKIPPVDGPEEPDSKSPFNEPVVLPIEDSLDLHPFRAKELPSVVEEYLAACLARGFSEVRLIHGKGAGVQRNIIRSLLSQRADIAAYHDAPAEAGSWGATIVKFKRPS